jgi:hypothetical protein
MNKAVVVMAAVCCFSVANAQTTLKMYTNYTYTSTQTYGSTLGITRDSFVTVESQNTNINMLPAIKFSKDNGRYVEYALANFSIKRNDDSETLIVDGNKTTIAGIKNTQTAISARSEVGKKIDIFKAESKLGLDLGFANTYSFYKLKAEPKVSNTFPYCINQGSIDVAFAPRISYALNSNCAIELSTLFGLAEVSLESTKIENPSFPVSQQTNSTLNIEVLPNRYVFRLGFAYKL